MLSDLTIKRDKNYNLLLRVLLKARSLCAPFHRKKLNRTIRTQLRDIPFTIFSNNCLGGVFYHDAGRQFTTPLINTALDGPDFISFLKRPHHYLEHKMEFITWPGHNYPIARIDDIEVRFVHDHSTQEAEYKFKERAKRIVWENIFIIATNHDGLNTENLMKEFDQLPYKNKIMFVSKEYPEYPWAIYVPQFKNRFQVRIMTNFADFFGRRYYETAFNIPGWIANNSSKKETNKLI